MEEDRIVGNGHQLKYKIIYADPPWQYGVWGKRGNGIAERHYKTQPLSVLKAINIPAICHQECILFMWATFPCVQQALELGKAWGFKYKTVAFVWVKKCKHNGAPAMGTGHYTRANAEIVLLFAKDKKPVRINRGVGQIIMAPRGMHSEKPAEVRKRIEQLYGGVPKIELFAREAKGSSAGQGFAGWDVFGDQISNSIVLPE